MARQDRRRYHNKKRRADWVVCHSTSLPESPSTDTAQPKPNHDLHMPTAEPASNSASGKSRRNRRHRGKRSRSSGHSAAHTSPLEGTEPSNSQSPSPTSPVAATNIESQSPAARRGKRSEPFAVKAEKGDNGATSTKGQTSPLQRYRPLTGLAGKGSSKQQLPLLGIDPKAVSAVLTKGKGRAGPHDPPRHNTSGEDRDSWRNNHFVPRTVHINNSQEKHGTLVTQPRRHATPAQCKEFTGMTGLPDELIDKILRLALKHPRPMLADHRFEVMIAHSKPDSVEFNILHTNLRIYEVGLPIYYSINTWVFPLNIFVTLNGLMKNWGKGPFILEERSGSKEVMLPPPTATKFVQSIILHIRDFGEWPDAIQCLRGFPNLRRVVFDLRRDWARYGDQGNQTVTVTAGRVIEEILAEKKIRGCGERLEFVGLMHESKKMARDEMLVRMLIEGLRREPTVRS